MEIDTLCLEFQFGYTQLEERRNATPADVFRLVCLVSEISIRFVRSPHAKCALPLCRYLADIVPLTVSRRDPSTSEAESIDVHMVEPASSTRLARRSAHHASRCIAPHPELRCVLSPFRINCTALHCTSLHPRRDQCSYFDGVTVTFRRRG